MVSVRAAKQKGSSFEYSCRHSLQKWTIHPVVRTGELGFQLQYDLEIKSDSTHIVFECKRLKGISWNQCVKFYKKLIDVTPDVDLRYLLFQSNRQPCLVFHKFKHAGYCIQTFEDHFGVPFEKHPSSRVTKK